MDQADHRDGGVTVPIQPMHWGAESRRTHDYEMWSSQTYSQDRTHWRQDPHQHIREKLLGYLPNKQRKTVDGWMFLEALNAPLGTPAQTRLVQCFVYSDGTKEHQNTPLEFDSNGDLPAEELARSRWWPCLVIAAPGGDEHWPFVCPALAWQESRPWRVHFSRLRLATSAMPFQGVGQRLLPSEQSAVSSSSSSPSDASSRASNSWQNLSRRSNSSISSNSSWELAD